MANTFITPSVLARNALATLYNTIVLAGLIHRDYDAAFNGHVGDTITVRIPTTFSVDEFDRNNGIQIQTATESSFTVQLDTIPDVSFEVTTEDMELEISEFNAQLMTPAMEAMAQYIDGTLAEALVDQAQGSHTGSPAGAGAYVGDGTTTPNQAWRDARSILSRNKHPLSQRVAVLSPEAVSDALGDDLFVTANESGSTDGLREASLGRKFGFDNYESQVFGYGSGDKGGADGVAFHRDAITLASRTLAVPQGAAYATTESYKGLGIRVVKGYDLTYKKEVVSLDMLIGVTDVRGDACVELDFGQGS